MSKFRFSKGGDSIFEGANSKEKGPKGLSRKRENIPGGRDRIIRKACARMRSDEGGGGKARAHSLVGQGKRGSPFREDHVKGALEGEIVDGPLIKRIRRTGSMPVGAGEDHFDKENRRRRLGMLRSK